MLSCVICLVLLAVSSHAENVELNSNKQRQFTCPGDQVIFTCRVFGSFSLEWRSPLITQTTSYTASSPPDDLDRSPFTASLVERSGTGLNLNFTSTLQVTASRTFVREATTVICLSTTANKTDNFIVAEIPTDPQYVTVNAERNANVTVRVTWMRPQNFDKFDIDRYDITVNSTSGVQNMTTACGNCTSTVFTVNENPSNVEQITTFTATIAAVNLCGETGPTGTAPDTLTLPPPPRTSSSTVQQYGPDNVTLTVRWQSSLDNGAPVNYTITVSPGVGTFTTSGTSVTVTVPYNMIHTASIVATNSNGSSSATMLTIPAIVNCSDPTPPANGAIDAYQNTTEGAVIMFICNSGFFVNLAVMEAVCEPDGRWNPDPATAAVCLRIDLVAGIVGGVGGAIIILILLIIIIICVKKMKMKSGRGSASNSVNPRRKTKVEEVALED